MLDGIDQMDNEEKAQLLWWLPDVLPTGLELIVSCQAGATQKASQRREWLQFEMIDLDESASLHITKVCCWSIDRN